MYLHTLLLNHENATRGTHSILPHSPTQSKDWSHLSCEFYGVMRLQKFPLTFTSSMTQSQGSRLQLFPAGALARMVVGQYLKHPSNGPLQKLHCTENTPPHSQRANKSACFYVVRNGQCRNVGKEGRVVTQLPVSDSSPLKSWCWCEGLMSPSLCMCTLLGRLGQEMLFSSLSCIEVNLISFLFM